MRVAMYLRQSLDAEGAGLKIDMQRENCLALVEREGWKVDPARIYVDNNVSASSAKARPAYQRLIAAVEAGDVDVVVAWNLDRLTRKPREIEDWLDLHQTRGVNLMTSEHRERIDLSTESGRMMLRITASVARHEVERKGRRQRESNQHRRAEGLPPGGRRAFGYTRLAVAAASITATRSGADGRQWPAFGHEPLEPEASAVRNGYAMLLAGATLRSIARAWNAEGLTTTTGHAWEPYAVRGVFVNPRYAGLVAPPRSATSATSAHNLRLVDLDAGKWEPLVSPETWAAARDLLADPARRSNPGALPWALLSGIATCGVCGGTMKAGVVRDIRVYRCSEAPHLARKREDADHYITHVVLERLSRPDAAELLADDNAPDLEKLRAELLEAQQGEADVLGLVARGLTTLPKAEATLRDLRVRVGKIEAAMTDAGRVDVLGGLVGAAVGDEAERWAAVAAVWQALDVDRQRAAVRALMSIEMRSPGKGSRAPRDAAGRLAHTARTMALTWH